MATEMQFGPFEPVSVYDAPGVAFSSLLQGEGFPLGRAVFDPATLTPLERETFATRMKQAAGGNPVVGALVDVALNPWVIAAFLFSTPVVSAMEKAGVLGRQGLFNFRGSLARFVRKENVHGMPWGFSTALQRVGATPAGPAYFEAAEEARRTMNRLIGSSEWGRAVEGVLRLEGVSTLDYEKIRQADKAAKVARNMTIVRAKMERLGSEYTKHTVQRRDLDEIAEKFVAAEEAGIPMRLDDVIEFVGVTVQPKVGPGGLAGWEMVERAYRALPPEWRRLGDEMKRAFDEAVLLRYGDEAEYVRLEGKIVPDPKKILAQHALLKNELFTGMRSQDQQALKDLYGQILDDDMRELMQFGAIGPDLFERVVLYTAVEPTRTGFFYPRGYYEAFGRTGKIRPRDLEAGQLQRKPALHPETGQPLFHPDDYELLDSVFGLSEAGRTEAALSRKILDEVSAQNKVQRFLRWNPVPNFDSYIVNTSRTRAWIAEVPEIVIQAQREAYPGVPGPAPGVQDRFPGFTDKNPGPGLKIVMDELPDEMRREGRRWTLADALWASYGLTHDPYAQRVVSHVLLPSVSGTPIRHTGLTLMQLQAKEAMGWLAGSQMGRALEERGGKFGKDLVESLRFAARPDIGDRIGTQGFAGWLARWLYVTHLGLNFGSVFLNLSQTMLYLPVLYGVEPVLKAYGQAASDMARYAERRASRYGGRATLSNFERRELVSETLPYTNVEGEDLLGIQQDVFELIDATAPLGVARPFEQPTKLERFQMLMMKPFEKAEWFNRLVSAHTVENWYAGRGYAKSLAEADPATRAAMVYNIRRTRQETQFGSEPVNTPLAFVTDDSKLARFGNIMTNPLVRQFMQFPMRSLTSLTVLSPQLGERGFWGFANDFLRGMGISAVMYEVGKNLLHADLNRALFFSSVTDILPGFAGGRFEGERDNVIPIPPVLNIASNLGMGLATGDAEFFRDAVMRLVPGGVALQRVLDAAPRLPQDLAGLPLRFQRRYVEWEARDPEGRVPVFDGTGRLLEWQRPSTIVMRGLGLPVENEAGEFDRFLTQNRDKIVSARQEMLRKLLANDVSGATRVRDEFQQRYGIPLTVTRDQLRAALRVRTQARTERILDRLPADVRPQFQQIASQTRAAETGFAPEDVVGAATANQRAALEARLRQAPVALDPQTAEALREAMRKIDEAPEEVRSFRGYSPF